MHKGLIFAIALVPLVLGTTGLLVAVNLGGEPDAIVQLTERELRLPPAGADDTGLVLSLEWQRPFGLRGDNSLDQFAWFDRPKLEAVGFDCEVSPSAPEAREHYRSPRFAARSVFAVLEYRADEVPGEPAPEEPAADEPGAVPVPQPAPVAQQPAVSGRRSLADLSPAERARLPRLVPVDVGVDARALRARYRDRGRFIVLPAIARLHYVEAHGDRRAYLRGDLGMVRPELIYVRKEHRALLDQLRDSDKSTTGPSALLEHDPRYVVTLVFGRNRVPWIESVRPAASAPPTR